MTVTITARQGKIIQNRFATDREWLNVVNFKLIAAENFC